MAGRGISLNHPIYNEWAGEQPLRLAFPTCYQVLLEQFAVYHLHPYDIKASVIPENDGFIIVLRYGEGLAQWKKHYFDYEALELSSPELNHFYEETAQACKKALISDYYNMMKP